MIPGDFDDAALLEHDIDVDGQDDPLRAHRVALEEAAQHEAKIKAKMSEVEAELKKMKDSRKGKGSGNPGKEHSKKKRMLEGQLKELQEGKLPAANAGLRKKKRVLEGPALARAVAQDAEHHAAPARPPVGTTAKAARVAAPRIMSGALPANAADEDSDDGAEDEDEEIVTENPTYYKIPLGQRLWIDKVKKDRRRATFEPPDPDLEPTFLGAMKIHIFAPHLTDGKPKPPCCYGCGWNSTIVSDGWNHDGRRVVGISKDDWVMGPTLKCKTCERKCNARRSRAPEEKKEDKEFMKVFMKGYRYKFESYSVESVRLYEEKYPGFMAKQDFVITTRRTAMTRTLADIVRPLVNSGMNPNNISNLAETKDLALTRSLLNATGAISDATAPGQHTLATALNRANLGNFVDEFSFREKKVGGAIIAIDHTLKTLKGQKVAQEKVSKNRLTVWSAQLGAPMIALSTATTSMDDDAFVAAANCYGTLLVDGRAPPKLCFLDNPARDAGGVLRRFDSLNAGAGIGVKDTVPLARQGLGPAGLAAILRNEGIEKIGVNFQGDITRLTKQYEAWRSRARSSSSPTLRTTLKSQKRRWSLADLVMELLNRTLDKELGGGGRYGRWDEWPLDQDAQQYAANDAAATLMVHAALLDPKLRGWVWVAPRDRAAAQDDGDAEADGDAELDGDAEGRVLADGAAELDGGDDGAADDGADDGEDDGADDDADDVGDLPNDDVEQEAPPDSVLAAATKLVVEYEGSNVAESLELPTFLDKSVRRDIHELARDLGLNSESVGDECVDRHLVISRRGRSSATPAATLEPADGAPAEEQLRQRLRRLRGLRIKYDPRHWMANWFLLAVSKNSTLYKYFCTATSDAVYKIKEGELNRLNAHLRRRGMAEDQIKIRGGTPGRRAPSSWPSGPRPAASAVVVDQVVEQVSGIAGLEPERRWQALYGLCQNLYSDGLETVLGGVVGALDDDGEYYVKTPVRPAPRDANGEEEDDEEDDDGGGDDESWDRGEKLRARGLVGAGGRCTDECVETLRSAAVRTRFETKRARRGQRRGAPSAPDYARGDSGRSPARPGRPTTGGPDDGDDY
ncbi:hypothetical protein JL720_7636 [Aureococcus anophagefferens]|nr:hypothetical protein JL720_7636 [Aureococcus anophagefferens]